MIDLFKEKKFTFIGTNLFRNNAFFVNSDYLNNLNTLDLESEKNLDKFVNANFRESRDRKNNLNLISPDKILEVIKDCEVIDVSNNLMEKRKISEF